MDSRRESQDSNSNAKHNSDADVNNQDANSQDANNQDANNQDANNQDANNQDANNQNANNQDANNQGASNQDINNEEDETPNDPYVVELVDEGKPDEDKPEAQPLGNHHNRGSTTFSRASIGSMVHLRNSSILPDLAALANKIIEPVRFRDPAIAQKNQQYAAAGQAGRNPRFVENNQRPGMIEHSRQLTSTSTVSARSSFASFGSGRSPAPPIPRGSQTFAQRISNQLQFVLPVNEPRPISVAIAAKASNRVSVASRPMSVTSYGQAKDMKKPYFSYGMCIICMLMFIVELGVGGITDLSKNPLIGPPTETLILLGAKKTDLIVEEGEWWRLVAPIFLHGGLLHLIFNLIGMRNIVFPAESEFGHWKVGTIFLLSGLFGEMMSALFIPLIVGVGASGAIFGLFGSCWADLTMNWSLFGSAAKPAAIRLTVLTIVNALIGMVPLVDNMAHMGGLLFGFVSGLALLAERRYNRNGQPKPRKLYQMILQLVALIMIPVLLIVPMVLLATNTLGSDVCPWCRDLTCAPIGLWECSSCFIPGKLPNGTFVPATGELKLECPLEGDIFVDLDLSNAGTITSALVTDMCKKFCAY